ncbi:hypothetical protein CEXT_735561 [Caerostris extrusa]|uniref:Uncharacterized protein n=1 Tax=Caerostris extrusa TaxID=172846 RepID=A0AAV4M3U8_CAEEX|nr:hypothetical protein CEXT_735561 [Caerostris extrusa]
MWTDHHLTKRNPTNNDKLYRVAKERKEKKNSSEFREAISNAEESYLVHRYSERRFPHIPILFISEGQQWVVCIQACDLCACLFKADSANKAISA